jgi:hypothetical protein
MGRRVLQRSANVPTLEVGRKHRRRPPEGVTVTEMPNQTATKDTTEAVEVSSRGVEVASQDVRAWLEDEFPGWSVTVDETATWEGSLRPLWIARREGHHPQAELSAAKLHTRLTDYLDREHRRHALAN